MPPGRPTRVLFSRVPRSNYQTTARFPWATYVFWYILDPLFRKHYSYYQRKVQLDRFLEKNRVITNCGVGVLLGVTVYFTIINGLLLPPAVGASEHTMLENTREIFALMRVDQSKDLPAFQLMHIKREMIGKLHAVSDAAEVRRQREEVQRVQASLSGMREEEAVAAAVAAAK